MNASMKSGWEADLQLGFVREDNRTVLRDKRHRGPLVVQKALYPEGDAVCHSIIVHPPGGIAGGDRIAINAKLDAGAHALITTPGATRWYRCEDSSASQSVTLSAAAGAVIEWLPQETIYFDRTRARNTFTVELVPEASFIGWEIACLGRQRAGEAFDHGDVRQMMSINVAGRLRWREQGWLRAGDALLDSPLGLAGDRVFATFVVRSPRCDEAQGVALRDACREVVVPTGLQAGVSLIDGALVGRVSGNSAETVRALCTEWWRIVRQPVCGLAAVPPRIWRT